MLAARRSMRRSPLLEGSWPALSEAIAASQSVLAIRVVPSLMLVPVVMKRLKSSRCSQLPLSISRLVPASWGWIAAAQARRAACSRSGLRVTGFLMSDGDGAACDAGERGHAELDCFCFALQGLVDLGEFCLRCRRG